MQTNATLPELKSSFRQAQVRKGLNTPEAASYLGVSVALLRKDRTQREPSIPFSKICGRICYYTDRLDEYIAQQEVGGKAV